jgi:hypothetical protein
LASKLVIIGVFILFIGIIFGFLGYTGREPLLQKRQPSTLNYLLSSGEEHDFGTLIGCLPSNIPNKVILELKIEASDSFELSMTYITREDLDNANYGATIIAETFHFFSGGNIRVETNIPTGYTKVEYFVGFSIKNTGDAALTVVSVQAGEISLFVGLYLWIIVIGAGIIFILTGLVYSNIKSRKEPKIYEQISTEPTLLWSSKSRPFSTSKNGLKVRKKSKKKKQPPKVTAGKITCGSCGQTAPKNSQFCPHCYGKLRA